MDYEPFAHHGWPAHIRVTRPANDPVVYPIRHVAPDGRETASLWVRTSRRGRHGTTEFFHDSAQTRPAFTLRPGLFRHGVEDARAQHVFRFALTLRSMLFVTTWKFRSSDGELLFVLRQRRRDALWRRLIYFPFRGSFDGDFSGLLFAPLFAPFFFVKGHPRISIEMPGHGMIGYLGHSKWHSPRNGFEVRLDPSKPRPDWTVLAIAMVSAADQFNW